MDTMLENNSTLRREREEQPEITNFAEWKWNILAVEAAAKDSRFKGRDCRTLRNKQ